MPCSALTFTLPFGASASRKIWLSTFRARVMSSGCGRAMLSPLTSWSLPSATPSACRALRATSLRVLRRSFSARCGSCGACVGPGSGPGSTSLRCPRPCRSDMRGRCVRRQASNAPSPESRRPSCRAPRFAAVSGLQARLREPSDRSDAAVRRYAVPSCGRVSIASMSTSLAPFSQRALLVRPTAFATRVGPRKLDLALHASASEGSPEDGTAELGGSPRAVESRVHHGEWRSLVAHPAGGRAVAGSNPVSPIRKALQMGLFCDLGDTDEIGPGEQFAVQ